MLLTPSSEMCRLPIRSDTCFGDFRDPAATVITQCMLC